MTFNYNMASVLGISKCICLSMGSHMFMHALYDDTELAMWPPFKG